jgi:hypothetical protein
LDVHHLVAEFPDLPLQLLNEAAVLGEELVLFRQCRGRFRLITAGQVGPHCPTGGADAPGYNANQRADSFRGCRHDYCYEGPPHAPSFAFVRCHGFAVR